MSTNTEERITRAHAKYHRELQEAMEQVKARYVRRLETILAEEGDTMLPLPLGSNTLAEEIGRLNAVED